jgi:hypothetical protein
MPADLFALGHQEADIFIQAVRIVGKGCLKFSSFAEDFPV